MGEKVAFVPFVNFRTDVVNTSNGKAPPDPYIVKVRYPALAHVKSSAQGNTNGGVAISISPSPLWAVYLNPRNSDLMVEVKSSTG
jgi:hypothetical protein